LNVLESDGVGEHAREKARPRGSRPPPQCQRRDDERDDGETGAPEGLVHPRGLRGRGGPSSQGGGGPGGRTRRVASRSPANAARQRSWIWPCSAPRPYCVVKDKGVLSVWMEDAPGASRGFPSAKASMLVSGPRPSTIHR